MTKISKETDDRILSYVARDLAPSIRDIHLRVGTSAILGGLLSLAICGQFGIGWTSFAEAFSEKVHANMNPTTCALLCGALFAIFPTTILRIASSPMLFRTIVRKNFTTLILWFGGFGVVLALEGHHGNDAPLFAAWVFAALLVSALLTFLFERFLPTFSIELGQFARIKN